MLTVKYCDSGFTLGDNSTAFYHFGVIVDPLSETAQKWSSLLRVGIAVSLSVKLYFMRRLLSVVARDTRCCD